MVDEQLKAILDLRLLSDGDIATDSRPANKHHESRLQHFFVVQEETHVGQGGRIARQGARVAQVDRYIVDQAGLIQISLGVHLDVIDVETGVGAVELVFRTAASFELVCTPFRERGVRDFI